MAFYTVSQTTQAGAQIGRVTQVIGDNIQTLKLLATRVSNMSNQQVIDLTGFDGTPEQLRAVLAQAIVDWEASSNLGALVEQLGVRQS